MASKGSEESHDYPTVLVATDDNELCCALVARLRQDGYLILEAPDGASAFHIVQTHSRPIHLMLTNFRIDRRFLEAALKQYRPEMNVLLVGQHEQHPDVSNPEIALGKVRAFFKKIEIVSPVYQNWLYSATDRLSDPAMEALSIRRSAGSLRRRTASRPGAGMKRALMRPNPICPVFRSSQRA